MNRIVFGLALALALPAAALAQGDGKAWTDYTTSQKCIIANETCFVVRSSAGGFSPEQRVDRLNEQLAYILGYEPLNPSRTRAVRQGGAVVIMIGSSKLTTITPMDAQANSTTVDQLANTWVRNLRRTLPQARPLSRS
jgi:hypothetical protein